MYICLHAWSIVLTCLLHGHITELISSPNIKWGINIIDKGPSSIFVAYGIKISRRIMTSCIVIAERLHWLLEIDSETPRKKTLYVCVVSFSSLSLNIVSGGSCIRIYPSYGCHKIQSCIFSSMKSLSVYPVHTVKTITIRWALWA